MSPMVISIAAFLGVAALVGAVAVMLRGQTDPRVEDRLTMLTGATAHGAGREALLERSILTRPLELAPNIFEKILERVGAASLLFEQADTGLTAGKFFAVSGMMALVGGAVAGAARGNIAVFLVGAVILGSLPLLWLMYRRRKRLKKFAVQLPDALELIGRALRSGHSLAAGFNLVQEEMPAPIGVEFGRVFEEQNLGIPLEEALTLMTDRVPNLDLKFFVTAVVLQRQTGGDLAEILDKIGFLIRERFKIWGQVQALTGEGRLSGIVLLALPPVLFVAVFRLNPEYVMTLFTDPLGKKLLAGAVLLQIVGALVIRKIINIKV